ncbi:flagellar basal body L-ring protein [Endozoicomonas sp. (ex Bugula neritina AB1)]|nr:flagellar basal body L-ring protein [Endozoicomonas sp. (ex Bugula neritina AB1)]
MIRTLLSILFSALLVGCASQPTPPVDPEQSWAPPPLPEAKPQQIVDGSLFNVNYASSLFEDRMAYRQGDILTVQLNEKTTSSKSSGTDFDKDSGVSMPIPMVWGSSGESSSLEMDRDFAGKSSSSQKNMLDGAITVSVVEVLSNGALSVRGEKWIKLNQGNEYIRISGILRPEDITPNNTVSSQRLANARITYSGEGPLADANEAGWLTQFFNNPLFPL